VLKRTVKIILFMVKLVDYHAEQDVYFKLLNSCLKFYV
jgi:hypothetical protein